MARRYRSSGIRCQPGFRTVVTIRGVRISTVILPHERWRDARGTWLRAEELGFHAAYTYDHLSWRSFRHLPWFEAMTTLAAAAVTTSTLRLGTLVTSPNFRHPVPLAKELLTLDDLSDGRLVVGIGSGGTGFDAGALGNPAWATGERSARFAEFTSLLDRLLTADESTSAGTYYSAHEVVRHPAPLAEPRPPFVISALGPRAMEVVAEFGQGWVTTGTTPTDDSASAEAVVAAQLADLDVALVARDRDRTSIDRLLLDGFGHEPTLESVDAFVDVAGRYQALGITEMVVHWPIADSVFASDPDLFERIVTEGASQLRG
jgi:alkanesulfonate monooxygenase SsuD/methylene tetrahydromethanopterin reductase-like flavin-dependent oxidoreductase (luciferase family)